MASGKRASMREGPLAALFRKTEEDAKHAEPPEPTPIEEIPAREAPHPSLAHPSEPLEEKAPAIPSPQDRLRSAFSSELPENLLEPATPAGERSRVRTPERDFDDVFARNDVTERATPFGHAKPAGQPVIRVVGVGGGGSNAINRMVEAQVAGVEFLAINTDLQSLQESAADI